MSERWPRPFVAKTFVEKWLLELLGCVRRKALIATSEYSVSESSKGTTIAFRQGASSSGSPGGLPTPFTYLAMQGNYIIGRNQITNQIVPIAKPERLRANRATENIQSFGSVTWNMTYNQPPSPNAFQARSKTSGGVTFFEAIDPPYLASPNSNGGADTVWAFLAPSSYINLVTVAGDGFTTTGTAIVWIEENKSGRAWGVTAGNLQLP